MDCTIKNQCRVAVYCRAYSDSEAIDSRKVMEDYYTTKVSDNPEWMLVHVFTDERRARPSLEKRQEFQKMLLLCRKGEIDLILTRSLTTFSRTVYDTMKAIRELQALDIPVIFEKENLNTSSPDTETLINLYAAFAKAESESLSSHICNGCPILVTRGGRRT
ncbi:recombinase family protein [Oscillospiraceae bacterium 38-13]